MNCISLNQANRIILEVFKKGSELKLKPLSVAVLDPGGHTIAFQRQDDSSTLRPEIAIGKASGALAIGVSSRKIGEMTLERPNFIASLAAIAPQGMTPAAGGIIIIDNAGQIQGAVGVTGDSSDNDETCALAAIAAAGLEAQS